MEQVSKPSSLVALISWEEFAQKKKKALTIACKCLIFSVNQLGLEPRTLPKVYSQIHEDIHKGNNTLLMCALYYIMYDHGFPKLALALDKTSLGEKQKTYMREGIKAVIDKVVETSIQQAYDKKSEWKETGKGIEDKELQQVINATLAITEGEA